MFQLLFRHSSTVFAQGKFIFLSGWPTWALAVLAVCAAAAIAGLLHRRAGRTAPGLSAAAWALETATVVVLLLLLWQPALSVAVLKPQQNVIAVVADDSRSMAVQDGGVSRKDRLREMLDSPALSGVRDRFQVRLYRLARELERIEKPEQLNAAGPATHIGDNLKQLAAQSAGLPLGAVVLLSDGSDNSGGVDAATIAELRRRRIPVHTVGFGRERAERDVELNDAQFPVRVLADSRVAATVTFRQAGFARRTGKLSVRDANNVLASREILFKTDGAQQTETITFHAGAPGAKTLQVTIEPLDGEENARNNALARVLHVDAAKKRILYLEGEPKWEFKFIRRAVEDDKSIELVTMLRTTQNKIYRQGIANPKELEEGFPAKPEELFDFSGVIAGGVEANYFTGGQQELLKQFVDRRGGGLLFLGGRTGLAEGGYGKSVLADLLPVALPDRQTTFFREPATVELTGAGRDSLLCRIEEDPDKNVARWKKLPYLADFQEVGAAKAGAVVLVECEAPRRGRFPLLATQNYGLGRTALLATAGTWRWQMQQPLEDKSHEVFWQQLLRWLISDSPGKVTAFTPRVIVQDDGRVQISARVRDRSYLPAADASVEARVMGPDGARAAVTLQPDAVQPGEYTAEWNAGKSGSYGVEVIAQRGGEEVGRDTFTFRREDGVAEDFHVEQNRELLQKLSEETGGHYYRPDEVARLAEDVAYSEAGISVRETRELWNMPAVFLLMIGLRGADWMLRRKWGAV